MYVQSLSEKTDWDREIDPVGLRISLRNLYSRYKLPILITENGLGAYDRLDGDGHVRDDYLRQHIEQCRRAVCDGVGLIEYCPWSFLDVLSTNNGYGKRCTEIPKALALFILCANRSVKDSIICGTYATPTILKARMVLR